MSIKYQLDMPPEQKKWLLNNFKTIKAAGYCYENEIYLYGSDNNIKLWLDIIIHENYHNILDLFNISEDFHHTIIEFLPNIFKYIKERFY